jgi:RsiW-degrading membrane proteinase PrsW (M82 family)
MPLNNNDHQKALNQQPNADPRAMVRLLVLEAWIGLSNTLWNLRVSALFALLFFLFLPSSCLLSLFSFSLSSFVVMPASFAVRACTLGAVALVLVLSVLNTCDAFSLGHLKTWKAYHDKQAAQQAKALGMYTQLTKRALMLVTSQLTKLPTLNPEPPNPEPRTCIILVV